MLSRLSLLFKTPNNCQRGIFMLIFIRYNTGMTGMSISGHSFASKNSERCFKKREGVTDDKTGNHAHK